MTTPIPPDPSSKALLGWMTGVTDALRAGGDATAAIVAQIVNISKAVAAICEHVATISDLVAQLDDRLSLVEAVLPPPEENS